MPGAAALGTAGGQGGQELLPCSTSILTATGEPRTVNTFKKPVFSQARGFLERGEGSPDPLLTVGSGLGSLGDTLEGVQRHSGSAKSLHEGGEPAAAEGKVIYETPRCCRSCIITVLLFLNLSNAASVALAIYLPVPSSSLSSSEKPSVKPDAKGNKGRS